MPVEGAASGETSSERQIKGLHIDPRPCNVGTKACGKRSGLRTKFVPEKLLYRSTDRERGLDLDRGLQI